jgi:hypothetical protein
MEKQSPTKQNPEKGKVVQTPEKGTPAAPVQSDSSVAKSKPLTMADLKREIDSLHQVLLEHTRQIAEVQEALARKRRPVPNGKVQIKDTQTGKIYPSKNATYRTLLKSGALKELVDKGIFGLNPEKNTFGWYALNRAWPDRFEEIKPENTGDGKQS